MSCKNHRFVFILAVAAVVSHGTSASAQGLVCQDFNNLTTNCGFDTDISGWEQFRGDSFSWEPTDGNDAPGSMEVWSEFTLPEEYVVFRQCVAGVAAGTTYGFGGFVRVMIGAPDAPEYVRIRVFNYDSTGCSGGATSDASQEISTFSSQWNQMNSTFSTDADTQSVLFEVEASAIAINFTLRIDDLYLGENLVPVELQSFTVE